jgi:uncharacterized repeat protein (TIGR01451 family)
LKGKTIRFASSIIIVFSIVIMQFSSITLPFAYGLETEEVYIYTDGSIYPPTAPIINEDNKVFRLNADINNNIHIYRENIVVDGAGFTLRGENTPGIAGIYASYNVTIQNFRIEMFTGGIFIPEDASDCRIYNNTISNYAIHYSIYYGNYFLSGIEVHGNDCIVSGNNVANSGVGTYGISIAGSDCLVFDNHLINNVSEGGSSINVYGPNSKVLINNVTNSGGGAGISINNYHCLISGNNVTNNNYNGRSINIYNTPDCTLLNNNITSSGHGVFVSRANCSINNNILLVGGQSDGVYVYDSNCSISENKITGITWGWAYSGITVKKSFCNIFDNFLADFGDPFASYSIKISDSVNCSIYSNDVIGPSRYGVTLERSFGCSVFDNRINNTLVSIYDSAYCSVSGNVLHTSEIEVLNSFDCQVSENLFENFGEYAVKVFNSTSCTVIKNDFISAYAWGYGVYFLNSSSCNIQNNNLNSVYVCNSSLCSISNNHVTSGINISNSSGINTFSNDITNSDVAIQIERSTSYVAGNNATGVHFGIRILDSKCIISNNNVTCNSNESSWYVDYNNISAVSVIRSNCSIINNYIEGISYYDEGTFVYGSDCLIKNNEIYGYSGIKVINSNHIISENTVTTYGYGSNGLYGVYVNYSDGSIVDNDILSGTSISISYSNCSIDRNDLQSSFLGIFAEESSCLISENIVNSDRNAIDIYHSRISKIFSNNFTGSNYGIYISETTDCIISQNTITNCGLGLGMFSSSDNMIYLNNFGNNTENINVIDSNNNIWFSSQQIDYWFNQTRFKEFLGNYWSDYSGTDLNYDGIGDESYPIEVDVDIYPLMQPFQAYFLVPATTEIKMTEVASRTELYSEDILKKNAILETIVTGDLQGTLNFSSLTFVSITSGPFSGQGFTTGSWVANIDEFEYTGSFQGVAFQRIGENRVYIKGSILGDLKGTINGVLTESINGTQIYDKYTSQLEIVRLGLNIVHATLNLYGTIAYQSNTEYSSEIYTLQSSIEGQASGYYNNSLNILLTHIRINSTSNPFYGQGFSLVSYFTDFGSGDGWFYNKQVTEGLTDMEGFFSNPLPGVVSAVLDESETIRRLSMVIERMDAGSTPSEILRVNIYGLERLSPGQNVNYVIEYRNDGLKTANNVSLVFSLPLESTYMSASNNGTYNKALNQVLWIINQILPKSSGYLTINVEVNQRLRLGTPIISNVFIPKENNIDFVPLYQINHELLEIRDDYFKVKVTVPELGEGCNAIFEAHIEEVTEEISPYSTISVSNGHPKIENVCTLKWDPTSDSTVGKYFSLFSSADETQKNIKIIKLSTDLFFTGLDCPEYSAVNILYGSTMKHLFAVDESAERQNAREEVLNNAFSKGCIDWPTTSSFLDKSLELTVIERNLAEVKIVLDWASYLFGSGAPIAYKIADVLGKFTVKEAFEAWKQNNDDRWYNDLMKVSKPECQEKIGTREDSTTKVRDAQVGSIVVARDPNIKHGPNRYIASGQNLTYSVEFENEGEGAAFGVYFTDTLDNELDAATLNIGPVYDAKTGSVRSNPGTFNPSTRTITWFVGEVGPKEGGYANYTISAKNDLPAFAEIINFATVYFPSVPETTHTNAVVTVVGEPDIAVTDLAILNSIISVGFNQTISVTVANQGYFAENFNLTLYANSTVVQTKIVTVSGKSNSTIELLWNTSGFTTGSYSLSAYASPVAGEVNTANNFYAGDVVVTVEGDTIPPITNAYDNGQWHTSDFTITLTASDEGGVQATYYRINNGQTLSVSSNGQPQITTEGASNSLEYWSVDINSNTENHKTLTQIKLDKTTPSTNTNYDGLWHTSDFTIILTASDARSGLAQTYYKINNGPTKTLSVEGQPQITSENAATSLEYWSVDVAGNAEVHRTISTIKLDKSTPTGSIQINNGASTTSTTAVTLTVTASDGISGIDKVRFSDDGVWDTETWEDYSATKAWTLTSGDGSKTVYSQIRDNAGLTALFSAVITLQSSNPTPTPSPPPTSNPTAAPTSNPPSTTPTPKPPTSSPTPSASPSPSPLIPEFPFALILVLLTLATSAIIEVNRKKGGYGRFCHFNLIEAIKDSFSFINLP